MARCVRAEAASDGDGDGDAGDGDGEEEAARELGSLPASRHPPRASLCRFQIDAGEERGTAP